MAMKYPQGFWMAQGSAVTAIKDEDRVSNRTNVLAGNSQWQQQKKRKRSCYHPGRIKKTNTQWLDNDMILFRVVHIALCSCVRVCVWWSWKEAREGARMWDMDPPTKHDQCGIELAQHNHQWKEKKGHPPIHPCLKYMQKSSPFSCTQHPWQYMPFCPQSVCFFVFVFFCLVPSSKLVHLAWPCALGRRWSLRLTSHPTSSVHQVNHPIQARLPCHSLSRFFLRTVFPSVCE